MIAALILATILFTSILSGIFGMAGGLILMGVLASLLPVQTALALHGVIQLASNTGRAILHRRYVAWRVLGWFALGSVASTAALSLFALNPDKFAVYLMLGLMPVLVWLPERWFALDAAKPAHAVAAGLVSTGLALASGVSGPITDLFFVRTKLTRHQVVATKSVMQPFGHASKVLVYGAALFGAEGRASVPLWLLGGGIAISIVGIMVGAALLDRLSDRHFQTARKAIVTVIGLTFLVQAARIAPW